MSGTDPLPIEDVASVISQKISAMPDHRSSESFKNVVLPIFEGLGIMMGKRGHKVFLHNEDDEVYLGIMDDGSDGYLMKVSMKQKDDRVVANYACMKTTSKTWETFEKDMAVNEVPDAINNIAIGILGAGILPTPPTGISQT